MTHLAAAFRLASAALILLPLALAGAQPPARVPSQTLLKRLAEAVDGNRHGRDIYIVARYDSTSPVVGVFPDRSQADALARRSGVNHGVFGPYRYEPPLRIVPPRAPEQPVIPPVAFDGCEHDRPTSIWRGPGICPEWIMPLDSIETLTLSFRLRNGTTRTRNLDRSTDAIFLSMEAIDKFVIPYYSGIIGIDAAAAMRREIGDKAAGLRRP